MKRSKREYSRVEVSWPMSIFTPRGRIEGDVLNISLTGALIRCSELPNPDEDRKLGIDIREHHHVMFATAEMVRLDVRDYDSDYYWYLLGLHFIEISEKDLRDSLRVDSCIKISQGNSCPTEHHGRS